MSFSNDELSEIAEWQPIQAGFGRDDPQTEHRIRAVAARIGASDGFGCEIVERDGLSNYFVLFASRVADVPAYAAARKVDGLLIYLSACAPVGVVGRSRKFVADEPTSHQPLEIEMLLNPNAPSCPLDIVTLGAIRAGGYQLLTAEDVSKPLPAGIKPRDYCLISEPWDRIFHALFSNTD